MAQILRQSTQVIVVIGPFVDVTDGFTPETGVTLSGADEAELLKANTSSTTDISGATWAAITGCDGYYALTLTTSLTDTVGPLTVMVNDDSVCLPVLARFQVIEEAAYDAMYAASADPKADINVASIDANAITATAIAADAITAAKLATGAITAAKFAAGAIDAAAIATGAIDADAIAADAITAAKIADGAIDANTFAASAITATAIAADAITAAKIANGAIDAATFAAGAIDAAALAADAGTEIATAVWASGTRTLSDGTNIVLAKGTGITGFNDLDAAGVRGAVGLASANLDTQLDALPTANEIRDAVFAQTVEGSTSFLQALRLYDAVLLGKAAGLDTATATYRDLADTKDRITATVDANGNRTAVTLDAS